MKILKTFNATFSWLYLALLFVPPVVATLYPEFIHLLLFINSIFIFLEIAFISIPTKKTAKNPHVSIFSYFGNFFKISALQFILTLLMFNLHIVFINFMSGYSSVQSSELFHAQISHLISWGLFPWSLIVLMGLNLNNYNEITASTTNSILQTTKPIMGEKILGGFGALLQTFLRQGLITFITLLVSTVGLSIYFYSFALGIVPKISFMPNGYSLMIFILVFGIVNSGFWQWVINKLLHRGISTVNLIFLQTIFNMLFIIILIIALYQFAQVMNLDFNQPFQFPMPKLSLNFAWELFTWSFWMAAVVFVAPIFANIVKGHNPRIIFFLSLLWPLLFVLLWATPKLQPTWNIFFTILNYPVIGLSINAISIIAIAFFCWINKNFDVLLRYHFHVQSKKKNMALPIKILMPVLRLIALFLLLYFFGGLNLLSLFCFGLVATCYLAYLLSGLSLIKTSWLARFRQL